jgi:uncharacterized UBP type Zn finger protein
LLTDEFFRMNVKVCLKCDNCAYERYVIGSRLFLYAKSDATRNFVLNYRLVPSLPPNRTMDEMYRHLSIEVDRHEQKEDEVRPKWTVTEGLEKFFQSDQRELKCEKCEEGTTATQTLSVTSRYVHLYATMGH